MSKHSRDASREHVTYDITVIGGGAAGTVAALYARRLGAKVAIARRSWGATALSCGAVEVASVLDLSADDATLTIADHVAYIATHLPRHPYSRVGAKTSIGALEDGYALLASAAGVGELLPPRLDLATRHRGLASSAGVVRAAATALNAHLGLDFYSASVGRWAVVQIEGYTAFDAKRVAVGLAHDGSGGGAIIDVVTVPHDGPRQTMALARQFDDPSVLDALCRVLAPKLAGYDGVLMPPLLGLEQHPESLRHLSTRLGLPVVEALAQLPSVPGVRLQRGLDVAVDAAGVAKLGEVYAAVKQGSRVVALRTTDQRDIATGAVVLATGRLTSGGIVCAEECREALFGLPVISESGLSPTDDAGQGSPLVEHPLASVGVAVDVDLRPLVRGSVAFENLFAAGMVVGGFGSRYVTSNDGVALVTGVLAAHNAQKVLGGR